MSFLRPDEPKDEDVVSTDQSSDQPVATDDASAQAGPASDQADAAAADTTSDKDVTVTTDEGSTLHTFNDPTLQSANQTDQASDQNIAADPLTFQDHDGTPLTDSAASSTNDQSSNDNTAAADDNPFASPVAPTPESESSSDTTSETADPTDQPVAAEPASTPMSGFSGMESSANPELDQIKREALEQLRPLLEKVDLPANEKFDKYLMMLRATDDPTLIEPAFNAAQGITEEKEKAEALVDIINEINYVSGDHSAA